ncbi:YihD family protein [Pantoea anthophila]|uniref:YihD family protein n=1 Tax=Pantoea anthophila TaxID=470931 RepID=UPI00301D701C
MKCHRLNELLELLQPAWQKEPDLNLVTFLQKLAQESGFRGPLSELTDDILIYHLKMRDSASDDAIPGLKKDYEVDFKAALLRARGVIKPDE